MLERLNPDDPAEWGRWSADHLARYGFAAEYVRGRRVLDAGTGPGYGAALLAASGARGVVAIDRDEATVAAARARYGAAGVDFRVGDSETLDGVGEVDVVCSFENIEHLTHPDRFVAVAARALAPGGVLLCSTPDRRATPPFVNGRPANPYHTFEWYADEFRDLLAAGFGSVDLRAQVQGHAHALREGAARALRRALRLQADAVAATLTGRLRRAVGRPDAETAAAADEVDRLATPSPADFPVVPAAVAALYGRPFCHLAVCTDPRR